MTGKRCVNPLFNSSNTVTVLLIRSLAEHILLQLSTACPWLKFKYFEIFFITSEPNLLKGMYIVLACNITVTGYIKIKLKRGDFHFRLKPVDTPLDNMIFSYYYVHSFDWLNLVV